MKNELLEKAWAAHGGLDHSNNFDRVHATIVTGGQLFEMKQTPQDSTPREMTVAAKSEWASVTPFGSADQHTDFNPNRIAIERCDGTVVDARLHQAEHAEGKSLDAAWDALDRPYC